MIRVRKGEVVKILKDINELTEVEVVVEGKKAKALNYNGLTGSIKVGDVVTLNTTAVYKSLGTGGTHFVMANWENDKVDVEDKGHIMKLRYTPFQVKCLAIEEQENVFQEEINSFKSLNGTPVVVGTLHSMLPPIVAGIKTGSSRPLKVVYIMTDGAALPLQLSNIVRELRENQLIDSTITVGHAFGGDYEAVNVYSGLIAAKEVLKADVIVVAMGPGIVGTGTTYGFTGVEQGEIINAVNILGGQPIAVPRISFADKRERHYGLSHHSVTTLGKIALTPAIIVLPKMDAEKEDFVNNQLTISGLATKHKLQYADGKQAIETLRSDYGIEVTTMGRKMDQDSEFFMAAGAAGRIGASIAEVVN